jgi:hypothetical protein
MWPKQHSAASSTACSTSDEVAEDKKWIHTNATVHGTRKMEVDDMHHVLDVQPTGGDSSDQDGRLRSTRTDAGVLAPRGEMVPLYLPCSVRKYMIQGGEYSVMVDGVNSSSVLQQLLVSIASGD